MMRLIQYPPKNTWDTLAKRPESTHLALDKVVNSIIQGVIRRGDKAVSHYTKLFDSVSLQNSRVSATELQQSKVDPTLVDAIALARRNITKFHKTQMITEPTVETVKGVKCWRKSIAIERVGLYVPGGSAPLFSTILMLGIPAKLAGCQEIVLCSPPNRQATLAPSIMYVAHLLGIKKVYKVGGAQAIAAMAYGTKEIPRVNKIFGPGNQFVTKAKQLVQQSGVAIDMPAGPSELLVIADQKSDAALIAADLLSQAEHGPDSQVLLLTDKKEVVTAVTEQLEEQLKKLPRIDVIKQALSASFAILLHNLDECIAFSNTYAPEHLTIMTAKNEDLSKKIINAGSVFMGKYSCESMGDYASGTNHTLPTGGHTRSYSGVSVDSFVKKITFQEITATGLQNLGPAVEIMAEAEQLHAHKKAVSIRLNL